MDTKRNKNIDFIKAQALKAKNLIEKVKPDIVLTSDDNAAKFLIVPYFKDSKIPFIFSGVNWTAEKYGFPFKNVTGMIEVNPTMISTKKLVATIFIRTFLVNISCFNIYPHHRYLI